MEVEYRSGQALRLKAWHHFEFVRLAFEEVSSQLSISVLLISFSKGWIHIPLEL